MGCVVAIPERDWVPCLRERKEERSPVATQRIISIPKKGLLVLPERTGLPRLPNPMTIDTITRCWIDWPRAVTDLEALITVNAKGVEIVDTPDWMQYLCIGEALAPQSEQRARVGTQRCTPYPLIISDRLVRLETLCSQKGASYTSLNPQTLARASPTYQIAKEKSNVQE